MVSVQYSMQMHDELATLFSRNLTFNPELQAQLQAQAEAEAQAQAQAQVQSQAQVPVPQEDLPKPIIYSVSQHYNHSAHIVKPQPVQQQEVREEPQRHSSEPPQTEAPNAETVLRNHGVDPQTLTPSQVQLFRIADPPQQMRLIELWSICPPGNGGDIPALAWSSTTVAQEEQLAQMRYERATQQNQVMSLDGTAIQGGDSRWSQSYDNDSSEPYMLSGYEELMRRENQRQLEERQRDSHSHFTSPPAYTPATDPVYMGADYIRQQQQMEMATQYGAFQQDAMDVM
ncbi:hypothetical protein EDB81DRAFT_186611 [Dactylonectria macrodidyma]|uniref:Uncharacterized protein n=1 Tax=Dactylonectria macrodidyma TaxID=307937 RepID=A0A9P9JH81_9HYPO|nr:hypothetical protein EDB81DRAFT_186611 [Dactylonectria macrodidyma]